MYQKRHTSSYYLSHAVQTLLLYAVIIVGLLLFCVPVYYMVTTSFKAEAEVVAIPAVASMPEGSIVPQASVTKAGKCAVTKLSW